MSKPIDFLLKCFNALNPTVAEMPSEILATLNDYRLNRTTLPEADTTNSTAAGTFSSEYNNYESAQSAHTKSAVSFGLTASYGPYSGSFQANKDSERESDASVINGTLSVTVDRGTLKFSRSTNPKEIVPHLDPDMLKDLNAIDSLSTAEEFTQTHGTHLVLGVKLGGVLEMSVIVTSLSLSSKESLALDVKGKYAALGNSIEAVAKASKEISTLSNVKSVQHKQQALGGDPSLSAGMDMEKADAIQKWVGSCTEDTVSGVAESMELYKLATNPSAKKTLELYLRLCLLKHSVEHPVIFSQVGAVKEYQYNIVNTTVDEGYKIISGGAALDPDSHDFLTGSHPKISEKWDKINSWQAVSHDATVPSKAGDQLICYAIGVYDPANLLDIQFGQGDGILPSSPPYPDGSDEAWQKVDDRFALTGGGFETSMAEKFPRYLTASYPDSWDGKSNKRWVARSHDNKDQSSAWLKAWVVGIGLSDAAQHVAVIEHEVVPQHGPALSRGNTLATLPGGAHIAGGGVLLANSDENLIRASFPVAEGKIRGWQEYNNDLGGIANPQATTCYAITLHLRSLDSAISFKPYNKMRKPAQEAAAD